MENMGESGEAVRIVLTTHSLSRSTNAIHVPVDFTLAGEQLIEEIEKKVVQNQQVIDAVKSGKRYIVESSCIGSKQTAVREAWKNGFGESEVPEIACMKVVFIDHCEKPRGSVHRTVHTGETHPVLNWGSEETLLESARRELEARREKFLALKDSEIDLVCRVPQDATLKQEQILLDIYEELFGLKPRLEHNHGFRIQPLSISDL